VIEFGAGNFYPKGMEQNTPLPPTDDPEGANRATVKAGTWVPIEDMNLFMKSAGDIQVQDAHDDLPSFDDCELFSINTRLKATYSQYSQKASRIFHDRQDKYGPANISNGGLTFLEARRNDKLARIRNTDKDFADETLEDAYLDMVNYWFIELMVVKGDWPKPHANDRAEFLKAQIEMLQAELDELQGPVVA
jgi:hypothetical protein